MSRSGTKQLLDGPAIDRALSRIAHEIIERNPEPTPLALVGIRTRGVPLARRLATRLMDIEKREVPVGVLDITLYRDDFTTIGSSAMLKKTEIDFSITDKSIVLVDDVLYTGRTIRAALDGLVDLGRARRIELAVLVDRGHRELPISADYVGKTVSTTVEERVRVSLQELDGEDSVIVGDTVKGGDRS